MVKLLLTDSRVYPSSNENESIRAAYFHKKHDVVQLLWNNNIVKTSLKEDNLELYNKIFKETLQNTLHNF